jgi:hypothetical protein
MNAETIAKFDALARAIVPQVNALLLARAAEAVERANVAPIDAECMARIVPVNRKGERVTDPALIYTCDDATFKAYYDLRHELLTARGYNVEPGDCPACKAEYKRELAERDMIDAASKFVPAFTVENLTRNGLKTYRQTIDTLVGLTTTHKSYRKN